MQPAADLDDGSRGLDKSRVDGVGHTDRVI
jgi:hypothetical protein